MLNKIFISSILLMTPLVFSRMTQDSFLFPKEVFFAFVCVLAFFSRAAAFFKRKKTLCAAFNYSDLFFISLLSFACFSIVARTNIYPALHPLCIALCAAFFYYEIKLFFKNSVVFNLLFECVIFSSLLASIFGFMQYYLCDFIFAAAAPLDKMRLFSFFGNKNYFSEYLTAVFFIVLSKIFIMLSDRSENRPLKSRARLAYYAFCLALNFAMIFIIQSRSSFLAIFIGCAFVLFAIYKNEYVFMVIIKDNKKIIIVILALLVFASSVYSLKTPLTNETTDLTSRILSIFSFFSERNIAMRFDIWHASVKIIKDHFWLGCGFGFYKMNFLNYQGLMLRENSNVFYENQFFAKANQAHNEYIQIFCEMGVFSFIIALAFSAWFLYYSLALAYTPIKQSEIKKFLIALCCAACVISVMINSLFGFPLHILPTALIFILAIKTFIETLPAKTAPWRINYTLDASRLNVMVTGIAGALFFLTVIIVIPSYLKANVNLKAGLDCVKLNKPDKAFGYLDKSIGLNPLNGEAYYYLGIAQMQKKQYDKAALSFIESLQTESDPNIYLNIGMAFYKIGMFDYAVEYFQKALELSPGDIYYLLNLGCAHQKKGEYAAAVEYFQKALSYATKPEALINLGHAYYLMGMHERANSIFLEALDKYGASSYYSERIRYLMGLTQMDAKNYKSAISNLSQAAAIAPDNPDYALNLALSYIFYEKTSEAELVFSSFLNRRFDELVAYNLAGLYYNQGRSKDAMIVLNKIKNSAASSGNKYEKVYEQTDLLISTIKSGSDK